MANGNPRLFTLAADNTLRNYELSGGAFVQVGATALNWATGFDPLLSFLQDGTYPTIYCTAADGYNTNVQRSYLNNMALAAGRGWASGVFVAAYQHQLSLSLFQPVSAVSNSVWIEAVDSSGALVDLGVVTIPSGLPGPTSASATLSLALSPDGRLLVYGRGASDNSYVCTGPGGATPSFTAYYSLPLAMAVKADIMQFSSDGNLFYVVDKADKVYVLRRSGTALSPIATLSDAAGAPKGIALSHDTRWVAVSYGTGITVLYRRTGDVYQKMQTLSGTFGPTMSFTHDSAALVDAPQKRAFTRSDLTWTEDAAMMAAVASGVRAQAVSPHVANPVGESNFYDGALAAFLAAPGGLSLGIVLLNSSATFNSAGTSLATEVGANEVYGQGWPQGGKDLSATVLNNVTTTTVSVTADDVTQIIVSSALIFHSAIIYNKSNNKPLIFIDFQADLRAEPDTQMSISFGTQGLILFTP